MTPSNVAMDHTAASELLPWLVNDTLEGAERVSVLEHVAVCRTCDEDVAVLRSMQSAIRNDELLPLVPNPKPADILADIGNDVPTAGSQQGHGIAVIALAASIVAMAAAGYLLHQQVPSIEIQQFETATSAAATAEMDYVLEIRFQPGTSGSARNRTLQMLKFENIQSEAGSNVIRATVRLPYTSLQQIDAYTEEVTSNPVIQSVQVIAVQLPVKTRP